MKSKNSRHSKKPWYAACVGILPIRTRSKKYSSKCKKNRRKTKLQIRLHSTKYVLRRKRVSISTKNKPPQNEDRKSRETKPCFQQPNQRKNMAKKREIKTLLIINLLWNSEGIRSPLQTHEYLIEKSDILLLVEMLINL